MRRPEVRNLHNDTLRTGVYASAAVKAFFLIHHRHAALDGDCAVFAHPDAVPAADAAVGAGFRAALRRKRKRGTGLRAGVFIAVKGMIAVAAAANERHIAHHSLTLSPDNPLNLIGNRLLSDHTGIRGSLPSDKGGRQRVTARIAAGTAVCTGKNLPDILLLLVDLYCKNPAREPEEYPYKKTDRADHDRGKQHICHAFVLSVSKSDTGTGKHLIQSVFPFVT